MFCVYVGRISNPAYFLLEPALIAQSADRFAWSKLVQFPVYLACMLLAQPGDAPRFRTVDKGVVEAVAALTGEERKLIPSGSVPGELGESWLRLCIVDPKTDKPGPAMFGAYRRDKDDLIFHPRAGLEPGHLYRAYFGPAGGAVRTKDYRVAPTHDGKPAVVTKIYPSSGVLPANVLKFYIYFSQPMRGGQDIFKQIQILDSKGEPLDNVWLADELWDENGQVLIIYIHPGRIKWGVILREVFGPVLYPDREYTFVVRGDMLDANGQKLGKDIMKRFRTTAEDRVRIELGEWKLGAPKEGSAAPLVVTFQKSIDHKSLERFLAIHDGKGQVVVGKTSVGQDEKAWSFIPALPWQDQEYRLKTNGRLEDVAGNTPLRPFDLDLKSPAPPAQQLDIPFRPTR